MTALIERQAINRESFATQNLASCYRLRPLLNPLYHNPWGFELRVFYNQVQPLK
jgi:hypothetical protein